MEILCILVLGFYHSIGVQDLPHLQGLRGLFLIQGCSIILQEPIGDSLALA
jgi:hypothetical protein